jgi:hypothetical protein
MSKRKASSDLNNSSQKKILSFFKTRDEAAAVDNSRTFTQIQARKSAAELLFAGDLSSTPSSSQDSVATDANSETTGDPPARDLPSTPSSSQNSVATDASSETTGDPSSSPSSSQSSIRLSLDDSLSESTQTRQEIDSGESAQSLSLWGGRFLEGDLCDSNENEEVLIDVDEENRTLVENEAEPGEHTAPVIQETAVHATPVANTTSIPTDISRNKDDGLSQPEIEFPKIGNYKMNKKWYKPPYNYNTWIEYSKEANKVFCFPWIVKKLFIIKSFNNE